MSDGSPLARLAEAVGILPEYVDQSGERRVTRDASRRALLAALGHDVADDDAARAALDALEAERRARLLEPVRVVSGAAAAHVGLLVDAHRGADVTWEAELEHEDGTTARAEGQAWVPHDGVLAVRLHDVPPLGYHTLRVRVCADGREVVGAQRLIVTPARCPDPATLLRGQRVFGVTANLYTVRSARNWGVGDLSDLATLLELAAEEGAAFVGVNPLHALRNADGDISPYSPVSRLYRNPLYLDVEAVAEAARAGRASPRPAAVDEALAAARESDALGALRDADLLDYEGVMALKRPVLEALHRAFRARGGAKRRHDYAAWLEREGEALESFARFQALDEHFRARGAGWWREWPAEYQDARSAEVEAFAHDLAARVDFHRWLQFEIDRQLGDAARRGRVAGMPIGLYQDLAIGTSPSGSDVWAQPELFVAGVSVGAPPDPLGPEGQNWGLPPIHPGALRADGYRYWATLVRNAMRHSGALRLDHVLGLFRQFWIPEGMSGADGAYVKFPTEDLFGVLALEATRAGALVVGEDLGTVPPEVPPTLARWGVLSSKVLYFEREESGDFKPTRRYPRGALATANTHDLAPLAGWWRGRDVALRREVGLLQDAEAHADALADRRRDRGALLALLVEEGVLDAEVLADDPEAVSELDVRAAAHALLRRSPSWLVGLSLDDLVGETEPVNMPGVGQDKFPCWRRRLSLPLERLAADPAVRRSLGAERAWVP
jgi:4-alpha-glucanotransferase